LPATGIPIAAITAASFVAALWLHEHPKLHRCADSPPIKWISPHDHYSVDPSTKVCTCAEPNIDREI
jgi:hypothetical protein